MTRLALLLTTAAFIGAAAGAVTGAAAQQPAAHPVAEPPAQSDADLVLPPPHGSPKELATGATRGLGAGVHARAETVTDARPAGPHASTRAGPRPLAGAPQP